MDWIKELEPVRDWYQGDMEKRDPVDILRDVVADLQTDRAEVFRLRRELERAHLARQQAKRMLEEREKHGRYWCSRCKLFHPKCKLKPLMSQLAKYERVILAMRVMLLELEGG